MAHNQPQVSKVYSTAVYLSYYRPSISHTAGRLSVILQAVYLSYCRPSISHNAGRLSLILQAGYLSYCRLSICHTGCLSLVSLAGCLSLVSLAGCLSHGITYLLVQIVGAKDPEVAGARPMELLTCLCR